ncbi:MAG: hypothetical protein R6X02_02415 [Enhygromyxa sp.]
MACQVKIELVDGDPNLLLLGRLWLILPGPDKIIASNVSITRTRPYMREFPPGRYSYVFVPRGAGEFSTRAKDLTHDQELGKLKSQVAGPSGPALFALHFEVAG